MNLPGIADEEFIRDKVPMTKEEIRILTMCKAKIRPDNIIWDIGAGTGSLSIEAALLAPQGEVYAIEKKDLAVDLLHQNIAKFKLEDKVKEEKPKAPKKEKPKAKNKPKFSYNEQREFDTIDEDIEKLEDKIASLEEDTSKYATDFTKLQEIMDEKTKLENELQVKYDRWEYLNNLAEEIANWSNN